MRKSKIVMALALAAQMADDHYTPQRGLLSVRAEGATANGGGDAATLLAELNTNFAAFKTQQEENIKTLENNSVKAADLEKAKAESKKLIDALQASVDDLTTQLAASQMNGGKASDPKAKAHADAILAYMRSGTDVSADLNKGSGSNGGYLVPTEWDRTIVNKLKEISPLRRVMRVQPTSQPKFSRLYNLHGAASGWVGETDARGKTGTPAFGSLDFETGEIYANPSATQQLLDDAEINIETWLADEVQSEFATQENAAFIAGDGQKGKPYGLLTYAEGGANATKHPLGAIKVVTTASAAGITADALIDLVYSLPATFSQNASFLMNRKTLAVVRKLKDGQGNYLWQPSYQKDQPSTVLGYPVMEIAEMPDVAANALPIAFGDFKRAYLILDRMGVRILRDPLTNKPYVQFYTTKRVGGGVDNPEAVRLLKVSA